MIIEPTIAIRLDGVSKRYFPNTNHEVVALDNISLDIYDGEWLYILGGNGCGKTSLLSVISKQCTPDDGAVTRRDNGRSASHFIESRYHHDLIPSMTIYENLMLVNSDGNVIPRLRNYHSTSHRIRFSETLHKFGLGLERRLDDQVIGLSGGQQQAVVAAKVLLSSASILLLDEFTSALDKRTAPVILQILREHCKKSGITVIAVTHDYYWIDDTADRVVLMESGMIFEILARGSAVNALNTKMQSSGQMKVSVVPQFTAEIVMEHLYGNK